MSVKRRGFSSAGAAGIWLAPLLLLATVAVFWPATGNDFTFYDDDAYVTANVWVREGLSWAGIHWAFTTFHEANWHPLTWISHMLDVTVFGLHPLGHHLVNVLLHAVNVSLLYLFLLGATGAPWCSALASALFSVHPLHVESVAWVAERKDVLCAFFWMLTLIAHAAYARRPGLRRYLTLVACFALSLLSKPMALTIPFVLLLTDVWPLGRWEPGALAGAFAPAVRPALRARPVLEKIPLFMLAAISLLITIRAQAGGGAIGSLEHYPVTIRAANALIAYVSYLGKTFWPLDLAVIYPHPRALPQLWQLLGSLALLTGISLMAVTGIRRRPWVAVGWCWFLGTLLPVIGLIQIGLQARADRYTYLPLVGVFVALSWAGADILRRRGPAIASCIVVVTLASLIWATRSQIGWWRNDDVLLEHAIEVTENNWVAHFTLALNLEKQGRTAESQSHYEAIKRIKPDFAAAHDKPGGEPSGSDCGGPVVQTPVAAPLPERVQKFYRLGNELVRQGRYQEATRNYAAAVRLAPAYAQAHNNLGVALAGLGDQLGAAAEFREGVRQCPEAAAPHLNLGNSLLLQGDATSALSSYRMAAKLERNSIVAHLNLGDTLLSRGERYQALFEYREALLLQPDHEEARRKLQDARAPERGSSPAGRGQAAALTKYVLFP